MLAWVDLSLLATGSTDIYMPQLVTVPAPLARAGCMYRGLMTNWAEKIGRIRVIVIATRGGSGRR